jgi:hypothetical protein
MSGPDRLFDYVEPSIEDRDAVWQLAQEADSSAVYLLWCVDYAESSLIARVEGVAVGCIVGRRLQAQPEELAILALSVSPAYANSRLRDLLLFNLIQRMRKRYQIRYTQIEIDKPDQVITTACRAVALWLKTELDDDPPATGNRLRGSRIGPMA